MARRINELQTVTLSFRQFECEDCGTNFWSDSSPICRYCDGFQNGYKGALIEIRVKGHDSRQLFHVEQPLTLDEKEAEWQAESSDWLTGRLSYDAMSTRPISSSSESGGDSSATPRPEEARKPY